MDVTPELLTFDDGAPVSANDWSRRRRELSDAIVPHEYGGMPPDPEDVEVIQRASKKVRRWAGVRYRTYEIRTRFSGNGEVSLMLSVWIPPGNGPFPVLLDADGCWGYFRDEVVREVLDRGNIAASLDRTQAAADDKDAFRETGLYRVFPEANFGVCAAWAWAVHRCVDALTSIEAVRPDGIAITGHSRGGKSVLLAGATDDRIALTNPNDSGIGGAGLNRLKMEGSEVIDDFYTSGNIFWFGSGFADYRHRDHQLPYDNHYLHALVAPRALLLTEAYDDHAANPAGTYAAALSANEVYDVLDNPDAIGWAYREGGHGHRPNDYVALLDFMDRHLHDRHTGRDFQRAAYSDLENILVPAEAIV